MDLEKELSRLREATGDWANASLVQRQGRLIQGLESGGPGTPAMLAVLSALH